MTGSPSIGRSISAPHRRLAPRDRCWFGLLATRCRNAPWAGYRRQPAKSCAATNRPQAGAPARCLRGTVLIREWHGVGHQVTIGADGVLYRGERYGSLSEVARLITGARWSGPRFFGVKA